MKLLDEKNYFFHYIDYSFYTIKVKKELDGMAIKILNTSFNKFPV